MRDLKPSSLSLLVLLVGLAGGCVAPELDDPARDVELALPDRFSGDDAVRAAEANLADQVAADYFEDAHLVNLIEAALANNQELQIAVQEVVIAYNEARARTGEYLPRLGVGAGVGLEKVGETTSQGASDLANGVPEDLLDFRVGLAATWELDVWGRLRDGARASMFEYLASVEGQHFLVTNLVAEIANSYYELIALDAQLTVLRENIALQSDALEIVRLEKRAARVTELAVQRFEAEVLRNRALQFDLEQRIVETENRVNFLVGRYPGPVERSASSLSDALPDLVQTGIPADLLRNRPDVAGAELRLAAAQLDVDAARKAFLPSLSLEAGLGYESYEFDSLLRTPESLFFGVGAGLFAPLLNRRALEALHSSANAMQWQAVLEYEQAVLAAYTEVVNQLSMIENLGRRLELQEQQVELLVRAIDVSGTLFQSARADYAEVLLTRRDALDARMELIETRLRQRQALVGVYRALGGGWREPVKAQPALESS
jgi:multidrug efflux system outer membrane protein